MTQDNAEFSLRDAMEILQLLDGDPSPTLDIRCGNFRLQCIRGASPSSAGAPQAGAQVDNAGRQEPRRHAMLRAPAAGRFYGDGPAFAPGGQLVPIKAGTVVGRIKAGGRVTPVTASVDGSVLHACVSSGSFVEYGQALLVIDAA
jgi:biotin carboxyl carrier protein